MKNKLLVIFQFIITLIVLIILVGTIMGSLEILNIVNIPEKYSVLKFLPSSETEIIVSGDYNRNIIIENTNTIKIEKNNSENIDFPSGVQSVDHSNTKNLNKYYYSQLDEYGKIIYDKFLSNVENLKTGTYKFDFGDAFSTLLEQENGDKILEKSFQSSVNAFIYDNPQVFYLDISKMYLRTETRTFLIGKQYNVYITPKEGTNYLVDGFNSKEEIDIAIQNINNIVDEIKLNLNLNNYTEYMKIRYVHDYLINNAEYDTNFSNENIYNIYGALVNKSTVCEGYAKAFKFLLDQIGIETIFIFGTGTNKEGKTEVHSWNYVNLNEEWYAVDVTWDDPIIIGGGYLKDEYKYRYFMKGLVDFNKDHTPNGQIVEGVEFSYPELNNYSYK